MKAKCVICLSVKGKRLCKIKETTLVCSRCCAEVRGSSCIGCSHYKEAEKYAFEKMKNRQFKDFIAEIDPEVDAEVDNALTFVEKGDIAKGEKLLTDLINKHPDLYIVHYGMGTLLAIKGNYLQSIDFFDNCLKIFPYFSEAWFNRGVSYKNLLDVGNALKSFKKVIELGNSGDDFVTSAQELLSSMGASIHRDTGLSLDLYLQSMEEFEKAFSAMQNREYEKGISGFQNVLKLNKNHPQSYGNLGLCYSFLGKRNEAISAFDKAIEIDPRYEPAITNKAIFLKLKDGEKMPAILQTVDFYKELIEAKK